MIDRSAIEQAYAFFHQKLKVYEHSSSEMEMDHIEATVSSYSDAMSSELFDKLSSGNRSYLHEHTSFLIDLSDAIRKMEKWLDL